MWLHSCMAEAVNAADFLYVCKRMKQLRLFLLSAEVVIIFNIIILVHLFVFPEIFFLISVAELFCSVNNCHQVMNVVIKGTAVQNGTNIN